jgi:hypothetical protein
VTLQVSKISFGTTLQVSKKDVVAPDRVETPDRGEVLKERREALFSFLRIPSPEL